VPLTVVPGPPANEPPLPAVPGPPANRPPPYQLRPTHQRSFLSSVANTYGPLISPLSLLLPPYPGAAYQGVPSLTSLALPPISRSPRLPPLRLPWTSHAALMLSAHRTRQATNSPFPTASSAPAYLNPNPLSIALPDDAIFFFLVSRCLPLFSPSRHCR
jgi:hypothetical protein